MATPIALCADCKSTAELRWVDDKPWFYVACQCGAQSAVFIASHGASEDEAIADWNLKQKRKCSCCSGRQYVADALGNSRPCSRCNIDEYHRWAADRVA